MDRQNETLQPSSNIKIVGWLTILIAFGWIVILSPAQPIAWMTQEESTLTGSPASIWPAIIVNIVQTALLLPLGLAAWLWRSHSPRYQGWFETAVLAALFPLFLLPLRFFISSTHPDRAAAITLFQLIGLIAYYLFLLTYRKIRNIPTIKPRGGWLPALLIAPILMAGWLYAGAFGGIGDLVVNLIVGLLYGRVTGYLLGHFLLEPLYQYTEGPGWDIALGSLGVGGVLAITAESFGFNGQIMLFLLLMPSVAWPLMGMLRFGGKPDGRSWGAASWLIGLVMAAMLVLSDVDELTLLLMTDASEIVVQLLTATAVAILIGRVLGFAFWLARNKTVDFSLGLPFKA
ncbi:MAG: hypothetical protein GY803_25385, partial [Chloroflexi bacterium]|nr:hypothetical protein [Chloroflexota bacterium]